MKYSEFISIMDDCCNDIVFSYRGKKVGIFPQVSNGEKEFHTYYGDLSKNYHSVADFEADTFFDGHKIADIYDSINDIFIS